MAKPKSIRLEGVKQNNLKNVTVEFPYQKLTVITGPSGSGKSSLAFDTLYAEGQRRYIESLSTYTRQFLEKMPKPLVDKVLHIPPAIALEQRNHVNNSRSTVGTQTEIVDYARLLWARVGQQHCSRCDGTVSQIDHATLVDQAVTFFRDKKGLITAPILLQNPTQSKKTKKTTQAELGKRVLSILQMVREQGYSRILWFNQSPQVLDLTELHSPEFKKIPYSALEKGEIFVVVDRLKLSKTVDQETRTRLSDSLTQALRMGKGEATFFELDTFANQKITHRYGCNQCGLEHKRPEPHLFSFNSPMGACPHCSGFGHTLELDEERVVPDPTKTLKNGAIDPLSKPAAEEEQKKFFRWIEKHGVSIGKRYAELTRTQKDLIWKGDPQDLAFTGINGFFKALERYKYKLHVRVFIRRYQSQMLCPECQGARLRREALLVKIHGHSIADFLNLTINHAYDWMQSLKLSPMQLEISREILSQTERRLRFLKAVGVGYLTLARLAKTLSGGEFQRINLATQLGNGLCGTLYVLDEPSIGLHAADTVRLIRVLEDLRDQGNTVVVVEHDLEIMKKANWLIEIGPGSGYRGGEVIAAGTAGDLAKIPASVTGKYLSGAFSLEPQRPPRPESRKQLKMVGCRENNLKNIDVEFPLERMVVVTGMSGSGKSTLIHKTLYPAVARLFDEESRIRPSEVGRFDRLYGAEHLQNVVLLDQKPIGKSSRSNPATYLKAWDEVRRVFANQVMAIRRGYTPQYFSFNVDGGRCPVCKGEGEITVDMHFMAEIQLPCEECDGKRFKKPILDVTYKNKNIYQILQTTIDDAYNLFRENPTLRRKLGILREVGLGYLRVGQSGNTLSGGESQRLKIASVIDSRETESQKGRVLYLFDEPTTGLHQEDIKKLMLVLQDLVNDGNSVLLIEHHLDIIAQADWVIDLGPEGGALGGTLIAAGPPHDIIRNEHSITGKMLLATGYRTPDRDSPDLRLRFDPAPLVSELASSSS